MKKKKLIIIVSSILVLLLGGFLVYKLVTSSNSTKKEETITPLLYEVTKEGSNNKMYLFGSIHVANKEDLKFPKYVLDAYNNSKYLACEYNTVESDVEASTEVLLQMMYQDGTTIKDHLREETYNKLVSFLTEKNMYSEMYDYFKPYFFVSLFTIAAATEAGIGTDGVDNYFISKAIKDNKEVLEVESSDYQLDLLANFPDELYELLINSGIDEYSDSVKGMKLLYEAWKSGIAGDILTFGSDDLDVLDSYTEEQKKIIEKYNKELIVDRNEKMLNKAIEYFNNNQDVFFMVGALHIVGDTGLATTLEQKGFTVKRISE